jgi:hypothetical protein
MLICVPTLKTVSGRALSFRQHAGLALYLLPGRALPFQQHAGPILNLSPFRRHEVAG